MSTMQGLPVASTAVASTAVAGVALAGLALAGRPLAQEPPTDRTDALVILQGTTADGRFDPAQVALVERWLGAIRKAHPAVAEIHAGPRHELGAAILFFDDDTERALEKIEWRVESGRQMQQGPTGIEALDALQRELGARLHQMRLPGRGGLWFARFAEDLDVPAVCRRYQALPCVATAEPNVYSGDADDIVLKRRPPKLLFVWKHGDGDSMAGPIYEHYRYFEVDTAADTITAKGELRPLRPDEARAAKIHLWGVPARFAVTSFDDPDAVLKAVGDRDWWVALAAVEVLGQLLAGAKTPLYGEDLARLERFERVRDQVAERPGASHRALLQALGSDDPDVRAAALRWLRTLSGLDQGDDAAGRRAFAKWVESKRFAR